MVRLLSKDLRYCRLFGSFLYDLDLNQALTFHLDCVASCAGFGNAIFNGFPSPYSLLIIKLVITSAPHHQAVGTPRCTTLTRHDSCCYVSCSWTTFLGPEQLVFIMAGLLVGELHRALCAVIESQ